MPGSHIPILTPNLIREKKPDYILILPWNIADEVITENHFVKEWGGQFVTFVPKFRIIK